MILHDWKLKKYYRNVRILLFCPGEMKVKILSELKAQVADYLEENPDADMEMLQSRFGTPNQIAASAL